MLAVASHHLEGAMMSASPENGPDRSILPLPDPENPPITEIDATRARPRRLPALS